jgi:NAD(P)-dependent dehydrogenase (short-subunit alcohol dehydrogenase family)
MEWREQVAVVTGGARGIGRATAEALARQGATILLHCRDRAAGEAARAEIVAATGNNNVDVLVANLAVQAEVLGLAEEVKARYPRLDVLINNAGAFFLNRVVTVDDHESTFAINHLAPFILTNALTDLLKSSAPSRVIMVASESHQRVTDPEDWESSKAYNGLTAYGRSKLANVMFSYDLAHRLEGTGVTVNCCHPGLVDTHLLESGFRRWWLHWVWPMVRRFTISAAEGATTPTFLASSPDVDGVTGRYFIKRRPATSSLISHDSVLGARLWNLSLRLTGELPPVSITGEHIAH